MTEANPIMQRAKPVKNSGNSGSKSHGTESFRNFGSPLEVVCFFWKFGNSRNFLFHLAFLPGKALVNQDTAQTGKHLLRTQNVSEQNQKHFLCPGHKICVRNKCCARGQTGKHLCPQQSVCNNVSSFARAFEQRQRQRKRR